MSSASFLPTIAAASGGSVDESQSRRLRRPGKPISPFAPPNSLASVKSRSCLWGIMVFYRTPLGTVAVLEADGRWTKSPAEIPDIARQVLDTRYRYRRGAVAYDRSLEDMWRRIADAVAAAERSQKVDRAEQFY